MKITEKIQVINPQGLHLRAGAKLVAVVNRFKSKVTLRHGAREANAKSILNLLALCALEGAQIEVVIEGEDAKDAWDNIRDLFEKGFHELVAV